MTGNTMPETCWAVSKRQVINLRGCCILLVDSVEKMIVFFVLVNSLWWQSVAETCRRRSLSWIAFYDLYFTVFCWVHLLADVVNQDIYLAICYPSRLQNEFTLLKCVFFLTLFPKLLQSVRRHSAIVLQVTTNSM